jgi:hypothetical protein
VHQGRTGYSDVSVLSNEILRLENLAADTNEHANIPESCQSISSITLLPVLDFHILNVLTVVGDCDSGLEVSAS